MVFLVEQAIIWDMVVARWTMDLEVIKLSSNPDSSKRGHRFVFQPQRFKKREFQN